MIYGNAVNGNGAPSGDEWNGLEIEIDPYKPDVDSGNDLILATVYISIGVFVLLLISVPIILTKRSINAVEESDFTKDYPDEIDWN